jgi:translation initiation factor 2 subunit 2
MSAEAEVALFDPTQKKKKRPRKVAETAASEDVPTDAAPAQASGSEEGGKAEANGEDAGVNKADAEDYSYETLLHRVFELVGDKPDQKRSKRVPLPEAYLVGTSKTLWSNFPAIVKALNRNPQHLLTYVIVELGTTANLDGSGRVVIKGRFMPKQLESLLKKYIDEYVVCKTCKGRDTVLKRENRLHFLVCQSAVCGSSRSVPPLNKGYVHNIRRKKGN